MTNKLLIVSFIIAFFASGCVILSKAEGLMRLKHYSDGQAQIERYVNKQADLFDKLVSDLEEGKLEVGISQKQFIRNYGDPVLANPVRNSSGEEVLLYRYPLKYFNTDRVYAYFDSSQALIRWEYKPYQ